MPTSSARRFVPEPRRAWIASLALFVGALALRLVYLRDLAGSALGAVLLGDGVAYDAWARRIAGGDWIGHEVFYQAPLYPYGLAALYSLFGPDPWTARVAQALLGAGACLLVARAGARLFGERAGWIAGALLALYAPAVFFDGEIQKGSLSFFFAALLCERLAALVVAGVTPRRALTTGLVVGLFALHRENALLLVPLLALWLGFATRASDRRLRAPALFLAGALVVLAPVAVRNRILGGELLPTTSQLGTNFYIGNHAGADGRYQPLRPGRGSARFEREDATALAEAGAGRRLSPGEVSRWWLGRALAFVRAEPGRFLALLAHKVALTWNAHELVDTTSLEAAADTSPLLARLARCAHFGLLAPLAAVGVWLTRRRRELAIFWIFLLAWTAAIAAFFVFARYRHPLAPTLALFAGAAVSTVVDRARAKSWRALAPALALGLAVALLVNRPLGGSDPRAVTYASLGSAEIDAGRGREGEAALARAIALSPGFAGAHLALAMSRLAAGDLDAAEAGFRRVLELDPDSAEAWNDLGILAGRKGRPEEAEADFAHAVAADAGSTRARFNLARALEARGDLAGAREQLARLVALDPGDAEAHHRLAGLLAYGGDFAGARREYAAELALVPGSADAEFKLALVLDRLGEGAAAVDGLRRALASTPAYGDRLLAEAARLAAAGRSAEAERLLRLLLAAAPDQPGAAAALARLAPSPASR